MIHNQATKLVVIAASIGLLACPTFAGQEPKQPSAHQVPEIPAELPPLLETHEAGEEIYRFWARADWWLAWIQDARFPALVTVGEITQPRPGALGADGTLIRFGGRQETHERQGARFQFGGWLDSCLCIGWEAGFSFLGSRNIYYEQSSIGSPAIARPFFNVNSQQQDASLVTFPGLAQGGINVKAGSRFYGAEAGSVLGLNGSEDYPVRLVAGLRYLYWHEDLEINENSAIDMSAPVFPGQSIGVHDHFQCDNYFYGGYLGLRAGYHLRRLELSATGRCSLGLSQEIVRAFGSTSFVGPSTGFQAPAGFLAVSSNSGSRVLNAFAVVPELDLDARFELTKHIYVNAGWTFLYWSSVARVGQQVDTNINPNLVPTSSTFGLTPVPQQPRLSVQDSEFWITGLNFGLELRF